MNTVELPKMITLNGTTYPITSWDSNANLDGFVGRISGLPIDSYECSEDLENDIFDQNYVLVYAYDDGAGVAHVSI